MVFRNLRQTYLLEVGLIQILIYYPPLSTTYHVVLHVDFSSIDFFGDL